MRSLLVDCSALCYAAVFRLPELSYQEQRVAVPFSFLRTALSLAERFRSTEFTFAWDSRESKRKELFPEYKSNRKHDDKGDVDWDDFFLQVEDLRRRVLPRLGFRNSFKFSGYEADDVIAAWLLRYADPKEQPVIVSRDNDLWQLLDMADMFDPQTKLPYTRVSFEQEWGLHPSRWADVKILAGCGTDGVPGVKGVGYKTAAKYLRGELKAGSKVDHAICEFPDEQHARNHKLVTLPFDEDVVERLPAVRNPESFKLTPFVEVCEELGFRSFLSGRQLRVWKELLCGQA